jgi:uncharacterized damage-inducible protein DinB
MKISQVKANEYGPFYNNYILQISDEYPLVEELEIALHRLIKFVQNLPMVKFDYRYAEGKWTIKDILQHLIDSERIFAYRALRFARNDKTNLPGFEENEYADAANANKRSIMELLTELSAVRQASIVLFKTFTDAQLQQIGTANNNSMSVRAIGFVIIGHQNHHQKIFEDRYLNNL